MIRHDTSTGRRLAITLTSSTRPPPSGRAGPERAHATVAPSGTDGADALQGFGQHWFIATWRAAVPRSRGAPIPTPLRGADGADALQGFGQHWFIATWRAAVPRSRASPIARPLRGA